MTADQLVALLEHDVRSTGSEDELQRAIASLLALKRIAFEREVRLNKRDRIDFMIGTIGVEVKVAGGLAAVIRQLFRYAEAERVSELVLVTSKARLAGVPDEMNGKKIRTAALRGGFL